MTLAAQIFLNSTVRITNQGRYMKKLRKIFFTHYKACKLSFQEKKDIFTYLNISSDETKQNLKDMIESHILGSSISIQNIQDELSQLVIEYYQKKDFNKNYYNFLSFLRDYVRGDNSYNEKILKDFTYDTDWIKVIKLYSQWQNVNDMDYSSFSIDELSSREKMIAQTSNELRQYKLEIVEGKVQIDNKKIIKIINDLESIIKDIGMKYFLKSLFQELRVRKYNSTLNRYLLPKEFIQYNEEPKLSVPYNYLINLSLKYIDFQGKSKYQNDKYIKKAISLSKKLLFLYDLQDFHNMNKNSFPQHWTIETLYKNILYDNVFRFKQMSLDKIEYILNGLFLNIDLKTKLGFTLKEYLVLITKLYTQRAHSLVEYPFSIFTDKEIKILDKLSHVIITNSTYTLINNSKNIDFLAKPLIKQKDSYMLLDKNYCAWNFYEFLLKELCYPDIGTNLENLIIKSLNKQNYKIYNGKYRNSQKEDAECDIVIETQNDIIFIEVKKKAITSLALQGDEVKIAEDIIDSFIHSQEQISKHEYSIKFDNKIEFENGDILEYKNKNIIKISISLFDNYMLNDKMMAVNIFEFFHKIRFSNPTKELEKKNRKIDSLVEKLGFIYKDNPHEYRKARYDIYFLSLELFLFYLEFNKPIDEVLKDTRQISYSTGDLYFEYLQLLKMKNYK